MYKKIKIRKKGWLLPTPPLLREQGGMSRTHIKIGAKVVSTYPPYARRTSEQGGMRIANINIGAKEWLLPTPL